MQKTFEIYRDGELDPSFVRRQRVSRFTGHMAQVGNILAQTVSAGLKEAFTPILLDIEDAANGSHLRDEYFEQRRTERVADLRQTYLA